MKNDYWEESGQVFVTGGMRYGLNANCRTICIGEVGAVDAQKAVQAMPVPSGDALPTPAQNVTDNQCINCGTIVPGKRKDQKLCSSRCRKSASRGKQLSLAGLV